MSKVEILRLDSVTTNDTTATASINANFQALQEAIENTVSRDGTVPNYMDSVLDLNSNRIINAADPVDPLDVVNLKYVQETLGDLTQYVTAAQSAATAAQEKAQSAASSATSAASSMQAAQAASTQAIESASTATEAATAAEGYKRDAESAAETAQEALDVFQNTGYGADLSYTNNTLQLLNQNGNALGNPVTIEAGNYKGEYSSSAVYNRGDYVNYQGTVQYYICISNNVTGHAPTEAMYWRNLNDTFQSRYDKVSDNITYTLSLISNVDDQYLQYTGYGKYSNNAPKVNAATGDIIGYVKDSSLATSGSYNDLLNKPTIPPGVVVDQTYNSASANAQSGVAIAGAGFLTQHQDISGKQDKSNLVTSLSSSSTDSQYPSAKCVYDLIGDIESVLSEV